MTFPRLIAALTMMLAAAGSQAYDFKSVGAAPVILYDAPSTKGGKLFVVPRGAPLEVVLAYGEWLKVRDMNGELAWTEAKGLSAKRNVIVKAANLKIRATPDDAATAVFTADKGVLLELSESVAGGWIKVRHRDGLVGFVKQTEVWGI
ncbi:SH3 domain-containing protein [Duganella sp. sic0402]|uniref:SH3 domain-containing protein n=1 Tax=Duganella sp. sic0402 TaxID=2854786 RepID=UPI001C47BD51|nr:SH3 domain-containing protein [Duganella sp. sic0402]MBV7538578.1 SH3 domain-containing protein [Duganella sp. sic0402]